MTPLVKSTAERLDRIESIEAIRAMVARYAIGADRRNDPEIMGPLFADDAVWEAEGFARHVGREAIAKGLAAIAADRILWTIHYMVSPLIELGADGAGARCRWHLWELATMRCEDDAVSDNWLGGWYDARLTKAVEGWFFTSVVLDVRLTGRAVPQWDYKKDCRT